VTEFETQPPRLSDARDIIDVAKQAAAIQIEKLTVAASEQRASVLGGRQVAAALADEHEEVIVDLKGGAPLAYGERKMHLRTEAVIGPARRTAAAALAQEIEGTVAAAGRTLPIEQLASYLETEMARYEGIPEHLRDGRYQALQRQIATGHPDTVHPEDAARFYADAARWAQAQKARGGRQHTDGERQQADYWDRLQEQMRKLPKITPPVLTPSGRRLAPPRWAGSWSHEHAWRSIAPLANDIGTVLQAGGTLGPRQAMSGQTAEVMCVARPLVIGPDQTMALPDFTLAEAYAYASQVGLPHDPVFIDMTGPSRKRDLPYAAPLIRVNDKAQIGIVGALVYTDRRWNASRGGEAHTLKIVPFGRTLKYALAPGADPDAEIGNLHVYRGVDPETHTTFMVSPGEDADLTNDAEPLGAIQYDLTGQNVPTGHPDMDGLISSGAVEFTDHTGKTRPLIDVTTHRAAAEENGVEGRFETVTVPLPLLAGGSIPPGALSLVQLAAQSGAYARQDLSKMKSWAHMVERAAAKALAVLYLVESANVEYVTGGAAMERRDAKRALKRSWPRADAVRIRLPARRQRNGHEPTGTGTPKKLHQVRSFYRHMTAPTHPHVRCDACEGIGRSKLEFVTLRCKRCRGSGLDPEKVKPCTRRDETTGQLTCPDGCRREFVPEHIRGEGDTLELKSLKVMPRA
jgi:hypothetical protein